MSQTVTYKLTVTLVQPVRAPHMAEAYTSKAQIATVEALALGALQAVERPFGLSRIDCRCVSARRSRSKKP